MKKLLTLIIVAILMCANAFAFPGTFVGDPKFQVGDLPYSPMGAQPLMSPLLHDGTKIIYGEDDRYEVAKYPNKAFRNLAKSVAGMVKATKLKEDIGNSEFYTFRKQTAGDKFELCEEERFADQYSLPICSGFLIAPDTLVTAGHCVEDMLDCANFKWVFDFTQGTERIKKSDVYSCKKIFERKLYQSKWKIQDYAVIQLDRPVEGRKALKFRRKKKAKIGTKLVVIGHPSGLPMKITDNGKVQRMNKEEIWKPISTLWKKRYYFNANVDTYAGNSGSPVFNRKTKEVEGILVQGGEDYVRNIDLFCNESNRLRDSRWVTEEKVFRITKVPYIKGIQDKHLKSLEEKKKK